MTIEELKRALVEIRDICKQHQYCIGCPFKRGGRDCFFDRRAGRAFLPDEWQFDDWKEDSNETD